MRKKAKCLSEFIMVLFVGLLLMNLYAPQAAADSYVMVKITKMPDGLTPRAITIKQGQKVIWMNEEAVPCKIKITSKVGLACSVPDNFYADLFGNYESTKIPQSGIAGICFIEKGVYNYEVRRVIKGTEEISPGKITVE
jgi:plastocyanin